MSKSKHEHFIFTLEKRNPVAYKIRSSLQYNTPRYVDLISDQLKDWVTLCLGNLVQRNSTKLYNNILSLASISISEEVDNFLNLQL